MFTRRPPAPTPPDPDQARDRARAAVHADLMAARFDDTTTAEWLEPLEDWAVSS